MLKEVEEAGFRNLRVVEEGPREGELLVEIDTAKETGVRYRIADVDTRRKIFRVSKLGKRGKPLAGHIYLCQPAFLACECLGREYSFRCRHLCMVEALLERGLP